MRNSIVIYFLLHTSILFSQVNFTATPSKKTLGLNERIKIEFSIDQDGDNFIPPKFSDFNIVGGPSQSIRNSWINGKKSYSKSYIYFLSPKTKGKLKIGQASIEVDGEIYKTSPIEIIVTSEIEKPKDPNDPNYIADQNIFLVAEISNKNPYLNEGISVTYKLYVSPDTGVDNWSEINSPRYADFWSNNIDIKKLNIREGKYKGRNFRYVVLRKTLLYPQKIGTLKIEPLTLDISVQVPTNKRDFFGQVLTTNINKTVSAGATSIKVKELPIENVPENFSGAVGDFEFKTESSKNKIILDDAFELSQEISGVGNFNLFDFPEIQFPNSLEVYQPEKKEKISKRVSGMKGKISNSYTIVPSSPGKYKIPSTAFSFFDPKINKYKTIYSEPIFIDVTGGLNESSQENNLSMINRKIVKSKEEIQFESFKTKSKFHQIDKEIFFNSKSYWYLIALPFVISILIILVKKFNKKIRFNYSFNSSINPKKVDKKIMDLESMIGNKLQFYDRSFQLLEFYFRTRFKINISKMTNLELELKLEEMKFPLIQRELFFAILRNCQMAKYTPIDLNEMNTDFIKIKQLTESSEKNFL